MKVQGASPAGPRGVLPDNQHEHGVAIFGGTRIAVRDVQVDDAYGDLVSVAPSGWFYEHDVLSGQLSRDVVVERVTGSGAARMCVAFTGGIGLTLRDSTFSDCRYGGVDLEPDVPGEALREVRVLRNKFSGFYLFAIAISGPVGPLPPSGGDIDGVEIRGNTTLTASDTCWPAIDVGRGPISNVTVADNTRRSLGDGVRLTDATSGSVTANQITLTASSPVYCGSIDAPVLPVRLVRSPNVTVGANSSAGY